MTRHGSRLRLLLQTLGRYDDSFNFGAHTNNKLPTSPVHGGSTHAVGDGGSGRCYGGIDLSLSVSGDGYGR